MARMLSHHADRSRPHERQCGQKLTATTGTILPMATQLEVPAALGATPRDRTRSLARNSVWLGFVVVLAASVMDLLDSTIAQTAAPAIRADLSGSYADLEWISAAYTLAMSVGLLV